MKRTIIILAMAILWTGCTKTTQGECPAPDDNIRWFYNQSTNGIMSSAGCVLCDLSVDESDYYAWTVANAAPGTVNPDPSKATPCLYVYPLEPKNWDSAAECAEMACSEDPNTNDGVQTKHHTWKTIKPKLYPIDSTLSGQGLDAPVSMEEMGSDFAMDPAESSISGTETWSFEPPMTHRTDASSTIVP